MAVPESACSAPLRTLAWADCASSVASCFTTELIFSYWPACRTGGGGGMGGGAGSASRTEGLPCACGEGEEVKCSVGSGVWNRSTA
jgi:hypothetical protein